ncbi:hypothetical protein [Bradyrhizobium sp. OAE829]
MKDADTKLLEIANTVEPVQDGRIHIEKITGLAPPANRRLVDLGPKAKGK